MPIAIDGAVAPYALPKMNCGGTPLFDIDSGCAYRCDTCNAVIGSVGQSDDCKKINEDPQAKTHPSL